MMNLTRIILLLVVVACLHVAQGLHGHGKHFAKLKMLHKLHRLVSKKGSHHHLAKVAIGGAAGVGALGVGGLALKKHHGELGFDFHTEFDDVDVGLHQAKQYGQAFYSNNADDSHLFHDDHTHLLHDDHTHLLHDDHDHLQGW